MTGQGKPKPRIQIVTSWVFTSPQDKPMEMAHMDGVRELMAEVERLSGCDDAYREVWEKARSTGAELTEVAEERDQLKAENEALRKKLTTVHFVCDRIPDKDGCRFIELENPQGESLGAEAGEWEIRPDGLAQLVVSLSDESLRKDAGRYRFLRQSQSGLMSVTIAINHGDYTQYIDDDQELDASIDAAMSKVKR